MHAAEVFTIGASGFAHWRMDNAHLDLLWKLDVPRMVGGAVGAYLLTTLPGDEIRPFVSLYLLLMGMVILSKALRRRPSRSEPPRHIAPLAVAGGFLGAIGGGGWGPMVASTLIGRGTTPRFAIGSVNFAEFFVTVTISATFVATIGLELWPIIAGLVLGGVVAAPFAAYATCRIPDRAMMILVAIVIILLSIRGVLRALA